MMQPGMEDIYRRHSQGLTRTAREADAFADTQPGTIDSGRIVALVEAATAVLPAPESVGPVNSPSPTT